MRYLEFLGEGTGFKVKGERKYAIEPNNILDYILR